MGALPSQYEWLAAEAGPLMLIHGLELYGVREKWGPSNNPIIMQWAKEIGCSDYIADSVPWCGLFQGVVAKRSGKMLPGDDPDDCLWALNWRKFGNPADKAMLGDTLVFKRPGGGHVGTYVCEDALAYHVLGGNTSDSVTIARILKERCVPQGIRRPVYRSQPANVRPIIFRAAGELSTNEA